VILLLDNYDSFSYNLVDYFEQLGVEVKVFRNDHDFQQIIKHSYSGIVLSPGPEVPKKAGLLNKVVDYYHSTHPMLGICLGHQAIGEFFGADLIKAHRPMHGKLSEVQVVQDNELFMGIDKRMKVVRYNSLVINNLPANLEIVATAEHNEVMAIKHKSLPVYGLQFHPEAALTQQGLKILKNWLVYNNIT